MAEYFTVGLNLMDNVFNPKDTGDCGLSVIFSDNHLTYCILDFKRNRFVGLQQLLKTDVRQITSLAGREISYPDFLESVFDSIPWLAASYRQTRVAWEGSKSTLVPAPLFLPGEKEKYFAFNFGKEGEEEVFCDHLLSMDAYQLFTMPGYIRNAISRYFQPGTTVHASSILIASIWVNYKNRIHSPRVFLHLRNSHFDLAIFDGKQMSYFNTFAFQQPEDVAYYLVFVLEQLNFNPETLPLVLLGNVSNGDQLVELLFRYVRHVEFGRRNETVKYSYMLNQLQPQAFYTLFNFFSCGL